MVRKVLIGAVMVVALFAAPASAQYNNFTITPAGVQAGGNATFQGGGCAPGSTVTLSVNGQTLTSVVANAQGQYSGSFVVNLPPGNYTVTATCGNVVNTHPLNVRGVSTSTPRPGSGGVGGAPLARTGSNTNTLAVAGAALLLVGGGAMVAARKRFA
jgi:LPXTG-motif cell wall-anchored protein